MNKLISLLDYGQSYWLDNLTRKKISGGELENRVAEQGLRGITSNPSIFDKAITGSKDYDQQIIALSEAGKTPAQIYDALTIKDVQDACDILRPVYDKSDGADGFVSLEVSPYLARATQASLREARRLFAAVGRPNCMIKIPGTAEGIPAIEEALYEGININITLLFSVERYADVARAYIRALERRLAEGKSIDKISSVASIFISRIDVLVDELLGQRAITFREYGDAREFSTLPGRAGIATARLAYRRFEEIFTSVAWKKIEREHGRVQRLLWASTSTKNPFYDDLLYVESLVGENTVNTLPDETIAAFSDHGKLEKNTITKDIDGAEKLFMELQKAGIDRKFIAQQLEDEGIKKFESSYDKLISNLAGKRMKALADEISRQTISFGKLEKKIKAAYAAAGEMRFTQRLFSEDPYLWKTGPEKTKEITHRLDWLSLPEQLASETEDLTRFAQEIKQEGYTSAVLLGMGGSSLCSEVAREVYGTEEGYPDLYVLDNTSPEAILALESRIDLAKTIFIVASKSGSTQETLCFFHYFYEQLERKKIKEPGKNFAAITDENTPLAKKAAEYSFRKVFVNPPDLGGRYSVLSYFGLVPMALQGTDISAFLNAARQMENSCKDVPAAANPGVSPGIVLGICQRHGRDKVTFQLSSSIASFGYWVEQLLAESTGKKGYGLIPVNGEPLASPDKYANDRIFIYIYLASDDHETDEQKLNALEEAGHPVIRIRLPDKIALGGEYYRWEIAVATAGMVIGIDPFDQPDVEASKKNTAGLLKTWGREGTFENNEPVFRDEAISIYTGDNTARLEAQAYESAGEFIAHFTEKTGESEYIALLPYFLLTDSRRKLLQQWRERLRDEGKRATTLLEGPRYLHSTGQLHKGGPGTGIFILLQGQENTALAIPGEKYGFETLHRAQALGDFRSLNDKGRRVMRICLGEDIDAGLEQLYSSLEYAYSAHKRFLPPFR